MHRLFIFLLVASATAFAGEPVKVCVAQANGPEAKNWKLQAPIAQRIEQEAPSRQLEISAPLLSTDSEKQAKTEAGQKGCSYVLLTSIEASRDQVVGSLNPNPYARPEADVNRSLNATPAGFILKYKLIKPDGKKVAAASVNAPLKESPSPADFQETGKKLIESVASQVLAALAPAK